MKCHAPHIICRVDTTNMTYTVNLDVGHLAEEVFGRFLHHEANLPRPFAFWTFEKKSLCGTCEGVVGHAALL